MDWAIKWNLGWHIQSSTYVYIALCHVWLINFFSQRRRKEFALCNYHFSEKEIDNAVWTGLHAVHFTNDPLTSKFVLLLLSNNDSSKGRIWTHSTVIHWFRVSVNFQVERGAKLNRSAALPSVRHPRRQMMIILAQNQPTIENIKGLWSITVWATWATIKSK